MNAQEYDPPVSGEAILRRQEDPESLLYLVAQRRYYSRAKRWLSVRWFALLIVGLGAPVVVVIFPQAATVIGGVAGIWLFAGRTFVMKRERALAEQAAAIQEQFDFYVYDMPQSTPRPVLPSAEEMWEIAGAREELQTVADSENLHRWYEVSEQDAGNVAVAICLRTNARYSYSLLRTAGTVWWAATALWALMLVFLCIATHLSLATFLLAVLFPLLPAFLDVVEFVSGIGRAARDRDALWRSIDQRIRREPSRIAGEDLRIWQESLYDLRRDSPVVFDFIYRWKRVRNEAAMVAASADLSDAARKSER